MWVENGNEVLESAVVTAVATNCLCRVGEIIGRMR